MRPVSTICRSRGCHFDALYAKCSMHVGMSAYHHTCISLRPHVSERATAASSAPLSQDTSVDKDKLLRLCQQHSNPIAPTLCCFSEAVHDGNDTILLKLTEGRHLVARRMEEQAGAYGPSCECKGLRGAQAARSRTVNLERNAHGRSERSLL